MRKLVLSEIKWLIGITIIVTIGGFAISSFLFQSESNKISSDSNSIIGLVCSDNRHDFGKITMEEAVQKEYNFVLKNTSDHPITILKHNSSCGCTKVNLNDNTIIPSGDQINLTVKADWAQRTGAQSAMVRIITDDAKTSVVSLTIRAFIVCPVIINPDVVNFGLLKPGQETIRIVELLPGTDARPFQLTAIENPSSNITISRIGETDEKTAKPLLEGSTGKFAIKITAPENSGKEETRIIFKTDLRDLPEIWLNVKARFIGSIVAMPQSVLFNPIDSEDILFREVRFHLTREDEIYEPKLHILWEGDNENPFFIEKIAVPSKSGEKESVVTIGFNRKLANKSLSHASLHIESGSSQIAIPIVAMGG